MQFPSAKWGDNSNGKVVYGPAPLSSYLIKAGNGEVVYAHTIMYGHKFWFSVTVTLDKVVAILFLNITWWAQTKCAEKSVCQSVMVGEYLDWNEWTVKDYTGARMCSWCEFVYVVCCVSLDKLVAFLFLYILHGELIPNVQMVNTCIGMDGQ